MRNVIVTGGSRGLGLAMATVLAGAGYRVIAIARHEPASLKAAVNAAAVGGSGAIEFRPFDLASHDGISALVTSLHSEFGALYGLVNNAALGTGGLLCEMRVDDIQNVVQLNTASTIIMTKSVARLMMQENTGRIVNIASIAGLTGFTGLSVYSATKASLIGFTRALAREIGQYGITVNAIAPGFIDTDMTRDLTEQQRERIRRRSALRRMPEAIDVARSVEYLLGDGGRNVTGTVITVDAGSMT